MITGRNTDPRNPSRILRIPLAISGTTYEYSFYAHFRGQLIGAQLSQRTTDAGTYTITVTDFTQGTTLLSTGAVTPSGTDYVVEFFPTGVSYIPVPDSQVDQLPLILPEDVVRVTVAASTGTASDSVLMLEFQGSP
jgi:hypothetical protein